ncbi:retrovirus-related pol polyprotein from transposon TNT 1-94 [Tanacetum coccineum]
MLDKDLYDSWKSRMELYMQNREHGRMILESVENGPLIWPTVEENGVIRTKKYAELSAAEKIQADCDMKATNIILQGLPADIYSLVNHHRVAKDLWERVQLLMQGTSLTKQERECKLYDAFDKFTYIKGETLHKYYLRFTQLINDMNIYNMRIEQFQVNTKFLNSLPPEWSKFVTDVKLVKDLHTTNFDQLHAYLEQHEIHANEVRLLRERFAILVFSPGDDLIACLNKAMAFLTTVASSRLHFAHCVLSHCVLTKDTAFCPLKTLVLSHCVLTKDTAARVVKCFNYQGEGHMARQCTQPKRTRNATWYMEKAMLAEAQEAGQILDEEQLTFLADLGVPDGQAIQTIILNTVAFQTEDLDTYDSDCDDLLNAQAVLMANISNYGSDVISEAQQDSMILSVIEQMSEQMINHVNNWEKANKEQNNESVTAKLERYKERVKTFKQRLNIDLSGHEKMIDSQMDDMVREKLALKEQVDSLEQNLFKQFKENECLLQTFTVFKSESKEKEDKYMENKIDLEKKIKKLDNILFKVGQSAQTVHMLTKPQALYDNIYKQALGYQNLFHLKKAQRIKPTLYDGIVMSDKHFVMPVINEEETLILEEKSRSKMSEKAKDPEIIDKNISHKPIDYENLNRLSENFGKPPNELPKVSLENESLKKLKFHLARFNNVVKIRTTPYARTEGEWGDLINEIMEVQTVFNQMDAAVQQFSVDKQCLKIAKKELLLENDRLLQQIMSQEVLLTVMNSMSLIGEYVNMDGKRKETCNLEAELLKSQNAFNDLLKCYLQFEKHCISLECSIQLNQEIFQKCESCDSQNAHEIPDFFAYNDLKAHLQDKDSTICKLKDMIKSMREKSKDENVEYDYCEIETKNVFKEQFDSIKRTHVCSKEQSDSLIDKLNLKSAENEDLKAQIQDKEIVEQAKAEHPLDKELDFACKHAQRIQELLVFVRDTCPYAITLNAKKVVQIVLWYLDFGCSKHMTGNRSQLMNIVSKFLGTVRFGNDHIARIMGNLEVAFWKNTCFIRNLEGVDILFGSCDTNLYTTSLDDMLKTSSICLLSKASKTKSWLWHRRLSHLNFGTINKLAKDDLARGIPRLKFQKDHLCSACELGKSKKFSHQPKVEDTNQEKLYLLYMDLCGSMHVASINGKSDDLGDLDAKADIGIFVGYAPAKKAFKIYNKRTQKIIETIHVTFNELTAMASEQFSSGLGL